MSIFAHPEEAAPRLAHALASLRGSDPVVYAIARGAFRLGEVTALMLEGQFDVALVGRLGANLNSQYAVGAIDESGMNYISPAASVGTETNAYLEKESAAVLRRLSERRRVYTPRRNRLPAAGRTVVVVDDAIMSGISMIAALRALRSEGPARLICAVPVATRAGLMAVRPYADETKCLYVPPGFLDIRQAYRERPLIEDTEIAERFARSESLLR